MTKKRSFLLCGLLLLGTLFVAGCGTEKRTQSMEQAATSPVGAPMSDTPTQPVAGPITPPVAPAAKNVRLIFVGDIMAHKTQLTIAKHLGTETEEYNFRPQFAHVKHLLQGDIVAGNFETVVSGKKPYYGYPNFNSPESLPAALKDANFNLLFLANNHILDRGISAGHRTREYLEAQGFVTAGIGKSKADLVLPIMEVQGLKIGFINRTYGSNVPVKPSQAGLVHVPLTTDPGVADDVKALRAAGADYIIASYHWGPEYKSQPSSAQRKAAEIALEAGVDAIIGHHPHILQPMEVINSRGKEQFVAWSLGNFVSGQRTQPRERTVVLALDLKTNENGKLVLEKVSVAPLWVDMVNGERVRILPTRFGMLPRLRMAFPQGVDPAIFAEIQASEFLTNKLNAIDQAVVEFLQLPPVDATGFHTVWQRPVPVAPSSPVTDVAPVVEATPTAK